MGVKMAEIFALPSAVEMEIKVLIKHGYYSSIDEVAKDAFRTLFYVKPDLRSSAAIELYKEGEVSLSKAAEMIGVSTIEFKDILANRGINRVVESRSREELRQGVEMVEKLRE